VILDELDSGNENMSSDHKLAFAGIRNFLAGRMLGVTRDRRFWKR
jgi:hypothetical protein